MKSSLNYLKKIFNEDNRTKLIGLLSILILLWLIFYVIPSLFISLFHTFLGNIILLLSILFISAVYSAFNGIIAAVIIIILYQISHPPTYPSLKESFWSEESTNTFLKIQNTNNPNRKFDTSVIEKQASQEEVDYFNTNGMWPWSQATQEFYIEASNQNPYIRSYPSDSMNNAQTIYNEKAIQEILKTQTDEGQMLLRGVQINSSEPDLSGRGEFGYNSGLITYETNPKSKVIVCDSKTNKLKQIRFLGYGGILTEQVKEEIPFDYKDLENTVPGFKFINEPCDPCMNIDPNSKDSCNFSMNLKNNKLLSENTSTPTQEKSLWNRILDLQAF
jgi:hypothetical protein